MVLLTINWSSVGLQVAQLLLSLSILVILHEFGHYITARWFGCRVEKFYLFLILGFRSLRKSGEKPSTALAGYHLGAMLR